MLEMVKTMVNKEVEGDDEEDPEELIEDLVRVFANEVARRFNKSKKRVTSNSQKAAEKSAPQPSMSRTTGSQSAPNPTSANRPEPAYHFESPCKNSALVTQVWNKTLDATIMISPRELLAVSTDMQKRFKEFTMMKRISSLQKPIDTGLFDMLYTQMMMTDDNGNYVAEDSAPLRTIKAKVGGKLKYNCVINNSSSIIAISKAVWQCLGAPIRSDLIMRMESSHGTVEKTIGVLKNYPIWVRSEDFYMQIQVSDSLPCNILLGRPFFMYTGVTTSDHPDGLQEITLRNPNTGDEITVITEERRKKKKPAEDFWCARMAATFWIRFPHMIHLHLLICLHSR
jgi:hypothetical protein